MQISQIEVKNFKSFNDLKINLNNFNVLVGAASSGKSNFIEIFKFIKDISENFEDGIYKHGGSFLQNFNINTTKPSYLKVVFKANDIMDKYNSILIDESTTINYETIEYEISFNYSEDNINLIFENIKCSYDIYNNIDSNSPEILSYNSLLLKNKNGEITAEFEKEEDYVDLDFFVPKSLLKIVNNFLEEDNSLIINSAISSLPMPWIKNFKNIEYYNFDSKFCKTLTKINGNTKLTEYGENLHLVLDNILKDGEKKRTFLNLLSILLPDVKDVYVSEIKKDTKIFNLIENYSQTPVFAPFVSDGTANILALICALYFSKSNILLFEEPEHNIHPSLFIQLVGMMREVANMNKQIIISTHSPEILSYCDLEDIHLISRDENGFSKITKPIDNKDVVEFIEELGIGQVFIDGYLGCGNE